MSGTSRPRRSSRAGLLGVLSIGLWSASAAGVTGLDYEPFYRVEVNSRRNGTHVDPHMDTSSDGRSVVVWEDDSDENGVKQVRMRIFDPTGRTIGNERTVNTYPPGNQGAPRVAMSPNGQYILVAFSDDVTGQTHVRAARYSWNSTSNNYRKDNTEDLEVSVPHANPSGMPSYKHFDVAINDAGRGVVVWEDDKDGNGWGQIHGVIFGANTQLIRRLAINAWSAGQQQFPSVAIDAAGDFVVAWEEDDGDARTTYNVNFRACHADGKEGTLPGQGTAAQQIPALNNGSYNQARPHVSMTPTGRFVVAWEDRATSSTPPRIASAVFSLVKGPGAGGGWTANSWQACQNAGNFCVGLAREQDTKISANGPGPQLEPRTSIHPTAGYVVAWSDDVDGNNQFQVRGTRVDAGGTRRFTKTLNPISDYQQLRANIAFLGDDRLLAVWQDNSDDTAHPQVHRRVLNLSGTTPVRSSSVPGAVPDFSIVILPDTQNHSYAPRTRNNRFRSEWTGSNVPFPETYLLQSNFIVRHAAEANIRNVVHVGDVTGDDHTGEWLVASEAHARLAAASIPYNVVLGNHDYRREPKGTVAFAFGQYSQRDSSKFEQFAIEHVAPQLPASSPGVSTTFPSGRFDNYYTTFRSNAESSVDDFVVLNLEFAPSKDAACWAQDVARQHPDKRIIVNTHCYLRNGARANCGSAYSMVGFDGGDLYREFVNRHSNVMMVLAGHVGAENHAPANRTWLPSGHPGYRVEQILTDYQFETIFGHSFDYGNGWLRTLRFSPGEGLIYANVHTVLDGDWHIFEEGASSFNRPSLADYQPPSGVTPTGSWKNPSHESHTFTHPYVPEWTVADYQENTSAFNFVDRPVVRATSTTVQPTLTKPAIARSADDFFVVVWEDDADGNGYTEVRARTFSPDGCEEHASFRVNSVSTGNQNAPQVYSHPDGRFVVIWEDERTGEFAIRARVYEPQSDGSLNAGPDVQLSDAGVTSLLPTIAGLESELVVGWVSSGTHAEVRWLSIDSLQAGAPAFTRTRSFSGSYVRFPRVSVNALGQTLLAWQAFTITGNRVHGVLLDDSGEVVDSYVHSSQSGFSSIKPPAVWLDDEGNGIAVWSERDTVLRAMLLSPSTPSTRVTTLTTSGVGVSGPSLTGLPNGDFALLWSTRVAQSTAGNVAGTWGEIRGRWYNPLQGHVPAPKGEEFKVSTLPKSAARGTPTVSEITKALGANSGVDRVDTFRHLNPAATVTEDRRLLVTWEANLYGFADPVQNKRMYRERQILVRGHKF